jgi:hypothetical protein
MRCGHRISDVTLDQELPSGSNPFAAALGMFHLQKTRIPELMARCQEEILI